MKVSVIIPTYNGAHKILNIINSLEQQTRMPDEVIIVIDGSTDGTAMLLKKQTPKLPKLTVIEQPNGGRASVRNTGAKAALGDLLIFIDDDMIAPMDFVKNHEAHHHKYKGTILTGGLDDKDKHFVTDFMRFRYWLHMRWSKTPSDINEDAFLQTTPYITAGNFSISSKLFSSLGGFDERLMDAEDYDLAKRAMSLHIPIYFSKKAVCWNNDKDNVTCIQTIKRWRQYANAHRVLSSINNDENRELHYSIVKPNKIKSLIYRCFAYRWWIDSVDNGTWTWLPEGIRYKLYDLVLTANSNVYPERVKL